MRKTTLSSANERPLFHLHPGMRHALARLNISQNEFARRCGTSSGFVSQLLNGERRAGPRVRKKMLDAFPDLTFDELFVAVMSAARASEGADHGAH